MNNTCFCLAYARLKVKKFIQFEALLFNRKYGHLWWSILCHFRMTIIVDIRSLAHWMNYGQYLLLLTKCKLKLYISAVSWDYLKFQRQS